MIKNFRIAFFGSTEFSIPSLEKLVKEGLIPTLVITQPDRKKGRKQRFLPTPVKVEAKKMGIPIFSPTSINEQRSVVFLQSQKIDLFVVVAYGEFLNPRIRAIPNIFCINVHPSLLPAFRGANPIRSSIASGLKKTGNTIFKIEAKMDKGAIIDRDFIDISPEDNYSTLSQRLSKQGANLLHKSVVNIAKGEYTLEAQNHSLATYTSKISKKTTKIDWNQNAPQVHNFIRSLSEEPGAWSTFDGRAIKILETRETDVLSTKQPGSVVEISRLDGIQVSTKSFNINVLWVKPEGKKAMFSYSFSLGRSIGVGDRFE